MATQPPFSQPALQPEVPPGDSSAAAARSAGGLRGRNRWLFFLAAWFVVLLPFLFWWSTWFGRPLSEKQTAEYLNDQKHPRHIQHALVQLGERMARQDPAAKRWYPEIARLASYPVEEVRNTDAWVMGQDATHQGFHEVLLNMLRDPSRTVRGNAALSLVRFGDASGRAQIVALLQPAGITAPAAGLVVDIDKAGTSVHQGGLIAKLQEGERTIEVRSPISGRIHTLSASAGTPVVEGAQLAVVDPSEEQAWEALRALYLVGQPEDLAAIRPYQRELPTVPDRVRQQAVLAENAIVERAKKQP